VTVPQILLAGATMLVFVSLVALYRGVRGPTIEDRIIAINVIGSNTVVIIALIAAAIDEPGALDIALVYSLLNFLLSIAISKFAVERGGILT
jgi:multicomponent Na+:H+ antiporter subunit F